MNGKETPNPLDYVKILLKFLFSVSYIKIVRKITLRRHHWLVPAASLPHLGFLETLLYEPYPPSKKKKNKKNSLPAALPNDHILHGNHIIYWYEWRAALFWVFLAISRVITVTVVRVETLLNAGSTWNILKSYYYWVTSPHEHLLIIFFSIECFYKILPLRFTSMTLEFFLLIINHL